MKYIRTTSGIYKIYEFEGQKVVEWNGEKVISQAYTIAKLCDEFVHVSNYYKLLTHNFKDAKNDHSDNEELYGAIWTDKGLIYVAKMNQEGKLELC
jgi:hypothetical protein